MFQRMFAFSTLLLAFLISLPSDVSAQAVRQLYGNGVHAYFAGRLTDAEQLFSAAINHGTQDPRCYYFRGVTYAKQGRQFDAEKDFRTAATLEAKSSIPVNIGMSLERIQGAHRMKLEAVRRDTKLAIAQQQVLQKPNTLPANAGTPIKGGPSYDPTDPFADIGEKNTGGSTANNEPPITGDVKGAASGALRGLMEAVSKAIPNGVNIGNGIPGLPGGIGGGGPFPPQGDAVDPLGGDNPFGGEAAGDDPFGGEEPAMEEGTEDPFGGDEPAMDEEDPFGTDDPVMEEEGGAPLADDDPFSVGDGTSDTDPSDVPATEEDDGVDPFADDPATEDEGPATEDEGPATEDEGPAMEEEGPADEDVDPFADDE